MRCSHCGNELSGSEKFCGACGAPVGAGSQGTPQPEPAQTGPGYQEAAWTQPGAGYGGAGQPASGFGGAGSGEMARPPRPKKTGLIVGAVAAVAVGAAAVGGLVFFLNRKDPKEVVVEAFENIYQKDQVSPLEELLGLSEFAEKAKTADAEASITIVMDSCSEPEVNQFSGSGVRITGKYDRANKKGAANIGVIFKDMDLASLDGYFDEETIMLAVPELSSRVFTLDISDGLADRIKDSPLLGQLIEEEGIDLDGLSEYAESFAGQMGAGGSAVLDFDALMTRYREGTKAQEKFKEALLVEASEKKTFSMDGKEVECKGYKVTVSKDSMIEFLSDTTDFFLNDDELRDQYLSQLERSVKLAELMGGGYADVSASDLYDKSMDKVEKAVGDMIDYLDDSLEDVEMDVYVAKKGRLAAVMGTTEINGEDMDAPVEVEFDFRLQGGSYLTQNMTADITLAQDDEEVKLSMVKEGTYDGKKLTCDISGDISVDGAGGFDGGFVWTGTYDSDGGDYDIELSVTSDRDKVLELSLAGAVDELEKGTLFHTDVDEFRVDVMDGMAAMAFSGEYSYGPLSEELSPLEGDEFDVLAADEDEWESVFMEIYMGAMRLMNQLSL